VFQRHAGGEIYLDRGSGVRFDEAIAAVDSDCSINNRGNQVEPRPSCLGCGFDCERHAFGDFPMQRLLDASDGMVGDAGQDLAQIGLRVLALARPLSLAEPIKL